MSYNRSRVRAGFTLVELSVVLIIIGLLAAVVTAGQEMLKNAKLQRVVTQAQGYITAVDKFREKYMGLPGDFPQAFAAWDTSCAATDTACNGDGNGIVSTTTSDESTRAWKHLFLGGYITFPGMTTPVGGTGTGTQSVGKDVPAGPLDQSGFVFSQVLASKLNDSAARHAFQFGTTWKSGELSPTTYANQLLRGLLSSSEASAIDAKIDDGTAWKGKFRTYYDKAFYDSNVVGTDGIQHCVAAGTRGDYLTSDAGSSACMIYFLYDGVPKQ